MATRTLVVGTAGHIDHGKSALVRALTGTDPDRLKEEQARGITIELGFAHTTIGDVDVALVDVPGHERFVRTMLAGAGGLDAVLLVIAADESVMPQTREHFDICRLLAIPRGIIVITKSDLADADTIELAALEARELVAGSALEAAPIIAVSAQTGAGLDELRAAIAKLASAGPQRARAGVTRLPIDRAFSIRGFGTVVTGTLVSGEIREGDVLLVEPGHDEVRVRGVQVHGQSAAVATAPRRVAVNLGGVALSSVTRGMTLASPASLAVTRRVDVHLELLSTARPLRHGARVHMHQGTGDWIARVLLSAVRLTPTDPWIPVEMGAAEAQVPPGGEALARLRVLTPAVLTRGDRVVLRAESPAITIGGAAVLDPEPSGGGIRRPHAAARLSALTTDDTTTWVSIWLADAGLRGLTAGDLIRRGGLARKTAEDELDQRVAGGRAIRSGVKVIDGACAADARTRILKALETFHREHPDEPGLAREVVRDRIAAGESLEALLDGLAAQVTGTDRLALTSYRPAVTGEDVRVRAAVDVALKAAALQPPDLTTLAATTATTPAMLQKVLTLLQREGRVVRLDGMWFHNDVLTTLAAEVRQLGAGALIDVAAAKARFGVSRKFAIPLLEHLDRQRVTRRVGDRRLVI